MAHAEEEGDGVEVDWATRAELKRVAVLFLLSAITLALFLLYLVAGLVDPDLVPDVVWAMWVTSMLCGYVATWFYGIYVTARARRWVWLALCALPPTAVPCSLAYSWIRRGEIEQQVLGG
jgi:hypothetical protein